MVKVSELTGALLDYWVGRAEGWRIVNDFGGPCWANAEGKTEYVASWRPSTDWAQGGPLIEKYKIVEMRKDHLDGWEVLSTYGPGQRCIEAEGDTLLQAICRAVVRAAFGDEVEELEGA